MLTWIAVFLAVTAMEGFWALYFKAIQNDKSVRAGFWSASIIFVSAFSTIEFVHNRWLVVPAVLGGFAGPILIVWYTKRKSSQGSSNGGLSVS